ncbi:MAG: hypothetical protein RLZZ480_395 [Candidatus Parcubacteria bacterium]|jgi:hypothetical protein
MESERNFVPKPEKPRILYHASRNRDISLFTPRAEKQRDENEGPQIFATPSKAMASVFLVETDDSWVESGSQDGVPFIIISDKERFESLDSGGTIYALPSDTFDTDLEKGLRELEYTSEEPVEPIDSEEYASGLEAMLQLGVKVCFVDKETFEQIKIAPDGGEDIVRNLQPYR